MEDRETYQGPNVYEAMLFRNLRLANNLKQSDVAEKLSVCQSYIQKIEKAIKPISPARAVEIAELFKIDVKDIITAALKDYEIRFLAKAYKEKTE